jgi:hypothetical protein
MDPLMGKILLQLNEYPVVQYKRRLFDDTRPISENGMIMKQEKYLYLIVTNRKKQQIAAD